MESATKSGVKRGRVAEIDGAGHKKRLKRGQVGRSVVWKAKRGMFYGGS